MGNPKNGRVVRDAHRVGLMIHFCIMVVGLIALGVVNRALTPGHLWIQWALLGWGIVFGLHLLRFEKGTMATMGRSARAADEQTNAER